MRRKYPGPLVLATLLMLLPAQVDAQALQEQKTIRASPMMPAFNPQEVREHAATHIVIGTVFDITSFWENGAIHSLAKVHPEHWLKGQGIRDHVFLKYDGGQVGDIERAIDPGPGFSKGEKATVFVSHMGDNLFKAIWKENSEVASLQGSASSFEPGGQGYSYVGHYWSGQPKEFTPNFDRGPCK